MRNIVTPIYSKGFYRGESELEVQSSPLPGPWPSLGVPSSTEWTLVDHSPTRQFQELLSQLQTTIETAFESQVHNLLLNLPDMRQVLLHEIVQKAGAIPGVDRIFLEEGTGLTLFVLIDGYDREARRQVYRLEYYFHDTYPNYDINIHAYFDEDIDPKEFSSCPDLRLISRR